MRLEEDIDDKLLNHCSLHDWNLKLTTSYQHLYEVTMKDMPDLWVPLEFALSVKTILNIKHCTLPFGGILLGVAGSSKTTVIELFRGMEHTFYSDSFTPRSFVSHNSAVKRDKLKDVDMLPKIKNKFFLAPELAPIFSSEDKDLIQLLGMLTRVLDGHGFESDSGAQGHRACKGEYMFTMLGAAVDIPHKVYKHLSALGPKLYFLRLTKVDHDEGYYLNNMKIGFQGKIRDIHTALYEYLTCFDMNPEILAEEGIPPKVPMNFEKDEELACKYIVQLARLLGPLRAAVPTWETRDTQGSLYAYSIPNIEEPSRAVTILHNLAAGHALSKGRNYVAIEDIPIVIQVVLSTASLERSKIFDLLISNNGYLRTRDVIGLLNATAPTARRVMTELKAVGLVSLDDDVAIEEGESGRPGLQMILNRDFDWFLSEDFLRLKKGDTSRVPEKAPTEQEKKEIPPPRSATNNLLYDYIIQKTLISRPFSFLSSIRGGGNSFLSSNEPCSIEDNTMRKHSPYWNPGMGLWGCENCKQKGDRFDMHDSVCRGVKDGQKLDKENKKHTRKN